MAKMKNILYKAKNPMDNKWIFGYPFKDQDKWYIIPLGKKFKDRVVVVEKTISQYINLNDKNGEMIFENDKVKVKWREDNYDYYIICEICFSEGELLTKPIYDYGRKVWPVVLKYIYENVEVIGNIYGN